MSEHITHTAICEDGHRLARLLDDVPEAFKRAWDANEVPAQLGGITRKADTFSVDLVDRHRQQQDRPESDRDPDADAKLAFVLGALTHRSIDRHMKPIFLHFRNQPDYPGYNECTIYCDVLVLREVYGDDERLFPKDLLDSDQSPSTPELERLAQHVLRRSLIALHTFKPQSDEGIEAMDAWLSRFLSAAQEFNIRVDRYVEIASNPDPEKWRRYLVETNIYNTDAPLIQLARRVQKGGSASSREIEQAIAATGVADGRYARALAKALDYIRAAGRFWRDELDADAACTALDVGVPEHSLTYPD